MGFMQRSGDCQSQGCGFTRMNIQKSIIAAVCIHALGVSLIWVGFPVSIPRDGVEFLYSGAFMPAEESSGDTVMEKIHPGPIAVKSLDAGFFPPWLGMRNLDKPKR